MPQSFQQYVVAQGRKWPIFVTEPDYLRLRREFDDLRAGLYQRRQDKDGRWLVVNRFTGEVAEAPANGGVAQLITNRLNRSVTLEQFEADRKKASGAAEAALRPRASAQPAQPPVQPVPQTPAPVAQVTREARAEVAAPPREAPATATSPVTPAPAVAGAALPQPAPPPEPPKPAAMPAAEQGRRAEKGLGATVNLADPESVAAFVRAQGGLRVPPEMRAEFADVPLDIKNNRTGQPYDVIAQQAGVDGQDFLAALQNLGTARRQARERAAAEVRGLEAQASQEEGLTALAALPDAEKVKRLAAMLGVDEKGAQEALSRAKGEQDVIDYFERLAQDRRANEQPGQEPATNAPLEAIGQPRAPAGTEPGTPEPAPAGTERGPGPGAALQAGGGVPAAGVEPSPAAGRRAAEPTEEPRLEEPRPQYQEGQPLFQPLSGYRPRETATPEDRSNAEQLVLDFAKRTKAAPPKSVGGNLAKGLPAGAGARTLAAAIPLDLKERGFVDIRGKRARTPADVAMVAQVFRDPRMETAWWIAVKDKEIVAFQGFTSRLPGNANMLENPEGRTQDLPRQYTGVRRWLERTKADGYWLVHNHPSGNSTPSNMDIKASQSLAAAIPGYKGHVVIDSGEFSFISPEADPWSSGKGVLFRQKLALTGPDPFKRARLPHSLVGVPITGMEHVAYVGRTFKDGDNSVTLIYRGGGQPPEGGRIQAIQSVPVKLFLRPTEFRDFLRGQQRAFGGIEVASYYDGPLAVEVRDAAEKFVRNGTLLDHVQEPPSSSQRTPAFSVRGQIGITTEESAFRRRMDPKERTRFLRGIRVAEPTAPYGEQKDLAPEVKRALEEFGRETYDGGAKDFEAWRKKITDEIGAGVQPFLPDAWLRMLGEQAREAAPTELPSGQAPPAPPTEPPRGRGPFERPKPPERPQAEGLTQPIVSMEKHRKVLAAAEDLARKGQFEFREELISDDILRHLEDGSLRPADMAEVLKRHDLTFADFGRTVWRTGVADAARILAYIGSSKRRMLAIANSLPKAERESLKEGLEAMAGHDEVRFLSWWRRVDNIRRGLLVTQLATAVRNFETQVGRLGLDVAQQAIDASLQKAFGYEQTAHPLNGLEAVLNVFKAIKPGAKIRGDVDALLEDLPRAKDRLFQNYSSDVARAAAKTGAEGAIDTTLRGAETAVDWLNWANRLQEYAVRRAVFQGELSARLDRRGIDLAKVLTEGRTGELSADPKYDADVRAAVDKALELTWAKSPEWGTVAHDFIGIINKMGPVATSFIPFPRFLVNSLKFYYDFSPVGLLKLLSKEERAAFRQGDMKVISRASLGMAMLGAAWLAQEEFGTEKWYIMRLPGTKTEVDIRPFNPFAAYLFAADVMKRINDGNMYKSPGKEILRGVLSVNARAGSGAFILEHLFDGLTNLGDPRKFNDFVAGWAGNLAAGLLVPLQQLTDVYGQFNPEARIARETRAEPFLAPIKARIPVLAEQMEPRYSPTQAEPVTREQPALRQATGLSVQTPRNDFQRELDRLQFDYREITSPTGLPALDNLINQRMGELIEDQYADQVNTAEYQNLGNFAKILRMKKWLKEIRAKAKAEAIREAPDLFAEAKALRTPMAVQGALGEAEEAGTPIPREVPRSMRR